MGKSHKVPKLSNRYIKNAHKVGIERCFMEARVRNPNLKLSDFLRTFISRDIRNMTICQRFKQFLTHPSLPIKSGLNTVPIGRIYGVDMKLTIPNDPEALHMTVSFMNKVIYGLQMAFGGSYSPSLPDNYGAYPPITSDYLTSAFNLYSMASNIYEKLHHDEKLKKDNFSTRGPATLGYLVMEIMRFFDPELIPLSLKQTLDRINYYNQEWLEFDIKSEKIETKHTIEFFFHYKGLNPNLRINENIGRSFFILDISINDELVWGDFLANEIIRENVAKNADINCRKENEAFDNPLIDLMVMNESLRNQHSALNGSDSEMTNTD